jgi:hypothetical protein
VCLLLELPNPLVGQLNTSPDSQGRPQRSKEEIACERARNQDAVYIAQMDLRCDLAETLIKYERLKQLNERTFIKVVLPTGSKEECDEWLKKAGITTKYIYPDLK